MTRRLEHHFFGHNIVVVNRSRSFRAAVKPLASGPDLLIHCNRDLQEQPAMGAERPGRAVRRSIEQDNRAYMGFESSVDSSRIGQPKGFALKWKGPKGAEISYR